MAVEQRPSKPAMDGFTFGEVAGKVMQELLEKEEKQKIQNNRKNSDPNNRISLANFLFKK